MKTTKKALLACGLSLVLCFSMLVGGTFAWFTDSVSNKGNKIQSGTLSIEALAYKLAADGTDGFTIPGVNGGNSFKFETTAQDLKTTPDPIISETLWEPGKSNAKLLKISNGGTLAAKIMLTFDVTNGGLENALWFDFIKVENGTTTGTFTKRPMNTLNAVAATMDNTALLAGENLQFILVYGMSDTAGNEYQGTTFDANVNINATQATAEEDGFGNNQYDKDAKLDFVSASKFDDVIKGIESGKPVNLMKSVDSVSRVSAPDGANELVINGNGNTITVAEPAENSRALSLIATDPVTRAAATGCAPDIKVNINGVNFIDASTKNYSRGISISNMNGAEINVTDGTVSAGYYAINLTANNENMTVRFKNSTIVGWAALNCFANNSTFIFENCTLSGMNTHSGPTNNFSIIVLDSMSLNAPGNAGKFGSGNNLTFNNCDFLAKTTTENKEQILSFQYGACNNTVNFNGCTFNYEPQDRNDFINVSDDATGNKVFMDGIALSI